MSVILAFADPTEEVLSHGLFRIGPMTVNNHMIMALVAAVLMLLIFPRLFGRPDPAAPSGMKNFFEAILEFMRNEVFRPALKEYTDQFVPFLWTMFFFILFCNVLGCIPFATVFELITGGRVQYLGGAATGSITTTAVLALCAFFFIHFNGVGMVARALMDGTYGQHGPHEEHASSGHPPHARAPASPVKAIVLAIPLYLWNFAPHPFKPLQGESPWKWAADLPMFALLLFLELIGALIKPFALCMRLFANMIAGHIVLAVLIGLIVSVPSVLGQLAVGLPLALLDLGVQILEIFVAFLHAYIFTFLTTLFLASAVAPEH